RYWSVTGVQTCALPISRIRSSQLAPRLIIPVIDRQGFSVHFDGARDLTALVKIQFAEVSESALTLRVQIDRLQPGLFGGIPILRSEERRVGKECESRGG